MNDLGYSLIISNEKGLSVDLYDDPELAVTSTSGFGLSAEISTTQTSGSNGSTLNSITLPERTLSFSVKYHDVPDVEAAKLRLHKVMAFKQRLKVEYISNNKHAWIYGYCETCETPENAYPMTTSITIICPDPFWYTADDETIMVDFDENGECVIEYDGDTPVGVRVIIWPRSTIVKISFSITNNSETETLTSDNLLNATGPGWVDAIQSYEEGHYVIFDTRDHYKIVQYDSLDRFTTTMVGDPYPQLQPGTNYLKLVADGEFTARCEYTIKSGGW